MNITRRVFLALLAALPGAALLAKLPAAAAAEIPQPQPAAPATPKTWGAFIEVGNVRAPIHGMSYNQNPPPRIQVASGEFVYGLADPPRMTVETHDIEGASGLRALFNDNMEQAIRVVLSKPECIITTRGVLSEFQAEMPFQSLAKFRFDLMLTEILEVSA